jgi:acyl-CoA thioesterase-1
MNNKKVVIIGVAIALIGGLCLLLYILQGDPQPKPDIASDGVVTDEAITIIAFGDSLTAGYGVFQTEAYPAQLERALRERGYSVSVINSGVSGETTRGNLERANFIRSQTPDIVILGIGGNDALRTLPLEETEKNMRATVEILQSGEYPPHVLLLQMQAPINAGREYKEGFDALYETLSIDYGLVLVPFMTEEIFLNPEYKLPDGIHYNRAGYQKVIEHHILPALMEVLDKTQ